jgi:hypothetical protein
MDLGDAYEDYQGEVRCWGCRTTLQVVLREGKLQSMHLGGTRVPTPPASTGRAADPASAPAEQEPT